MAKICLKPGCNNPIFSHKYCKYHQYLRKDDKYKPYKYIKKPTGELELFKDIWNTRPHISFLTSSPLGFFNVSYFAHILPKGKYPKAKLDPENIVLLKTQEHFLLDFGTKEQRKIYEEMHRCDFQIIYELKNKLLIKYG